MKITSKEAWDFLKNNNYKLPLGYQVFYRLTKYSEWVSADFSWCIERDYYYEKGINTGKHSYELCITPLYNDKKYNSPYFLWELDEFDYNCIGIEYIDFKNNI